MNSKFVSEFRQAVLHLRWLCRMHYPEHETVSLQCPQGMREHALTHPADSLDELAEAMRSLEQQDQDQSAPPGGDMIQDTAGRAVSITYISDPGRLRSTPGPPASAHSR